MKYTKKYPIHPKPDKQFSGASIFRSGGWLDNPEDDAIVGRYNKSVPGLQEQQKSAKEWATKILKNEPTQLQLAQDKIESDNYNASKFINPEGSHSQPTKENPQGLASGKVEQDYTPEMIAASLFMPAARFTGRLSGVKNFAADAVTGATGSPTQASKAGVKIRITGRPIVEKQFTAAVENAPAPNKWLNTSDSFGTMEQGVVKGPPSTQESVMKSFTGKEPQFKSEIDWAKWNKEIPDDKVLMQEYNAIEQTSKANGTWMKNPDGSKFEGTPEQFVQQNSSNFKKAFPNGNDITYRGSTNQMSKKGFLNEDKVSGSIFTANKEAAISYGPGKRGYNEGAIFKKTEDTGNKVHELYYPTSKNSINIDNQGRSWRELPKDIIPRPEDYIDKYGDLKSASYKYRDTDELAKYLEDNNIDNATIKNIFDGVDVEKEVILNHKPGNYLKSTYGNNGMFDMSNPNIYKTVIPGILGTAALANEKKYGGWLDNYK